MCPGAVYSRQLLPLVIRGKKPFLGEAQMNSAYKKKQKKNNLLADHEIAFVTV